MTICVACSPKPHGELQVLSIARRADRRRGQHIRQVALARRPDWTTRPPRSDGSGLERERRRHGSRRRLGDHREGDGGAEAGLLPPNSPWP